MPPDRESEWHEFCETFAKLAGVTGGGPSVERFIGQSFPFHIPSSGPTRWRHIKHMYAAYKAGFIDDEDIARLYPKHAAN